MDIRSPFNSLRTWFKAQHFGRSAVDSRYALAEACIIGILSAFAAILLKTGIGWLGGLRIQLAHQFGAGVILPLGGLLLGLLAGWFLEWGSPEAAGGGIPQVKAALARYPIVLSLRVAVVKLIGTTLVLGAGLTLGRRAPTVHIGAALAAQLSSWVPTSPEHRRQMIAAGAAAGLAAGFTTPIAGVLFVIEELMRDVSGLTLETAIVASVTGAIVSLMLQNEPPALAESINITFSASQIPFYLILGALSGFLGAIFNQGVLFLQKLQRRLNLSLAWRIGLVSCLSGAVISLLPPFFRDNTGLGEFLSTGELSWQITALAFVVYFFLTMLAYSSGAPGGLLAPALVLGSALGYLLGEAEKNFIGFNSEDTYALVGMGAFFTGVVRGPVTAIVIVFELHRNFNIVLPLMISCAVSYIVAESVFKGSLYEHLLKASGIQITEQMPKNDVLTTLKANDVMQSQVETLASELTLDEVLSLMSRSHHRGFPVVEKGKLVGIFTQSDLNKLKQKSGQTYIKEVMTPNPITVNPSTDISDVLYLLNRYQLSRLPVTEGKKLVGIITRTDIIRVEANQLSGNSEKRAKSPSYIVYQTRSPAIGRGRILLPIANPQTAEALFKIAVAIAESHHYEIDCLQVIKIPKHSLPSEIAVDTRNSRKILHRLERLGRRTEIPVHTQIRVAQDTAEAILETISERHINLMIMGWKGTTFTQGAIFGDVVDTLIHQANCDLVLVKLGSSPTAYPYHLDAKGSWMIPVAGGPNVQRAMQLLPSLTRIYTRSDVPEVFLCKVYSPSFLTPDLTSLEKASEFLKLTLKKPIFSVPLRSASVSEAVIHLAQAQGCDAVILGASREGLLQQAIHGNIPNAIAKGVESTVILVRSAI